MDLRSVLSKRKRINETNTGAQLHPGEWRGGKKSRSPSRSGSPTASGTSTPGPSDSNAPIQPHQDSRSPSLSNNVPQAPERSAPTIAQPTSATPRDPSNTTTSASSSGRVTSTAWTGLEQALQALQISTKACPPLRSAIEDLMSCLPLFETALKCRKDYESLTTGLNAMVTLLAHHLGDGSSERITDTLTGIADAIKKEIKSIRNRQSRDGLRRVLGPGGDEEDLIRRYRRIEQLFCQLQGEASLSAWSISSKHYVNAQLESLHPAKLARFNSQMSMEVSRRACTENTRVEILENLMKWSEDCSTANIYWMNGMAGTGKTTIAYSACAALDDTKQLAASFFCVRTSPECRDAKRIVPTIAYQLARRFTPFRSALCKALEEDTDIATGTIAAQFDQLIRNPLMKAKNNMPNNLVVVVDALDECDDPYIVELFLGVLFRSVVNLPLKFFVTSRPEPAIRHRMMVESERSRSILYLHEIERSLVQADIERYLRDELGSISIDDGIKQLSVQAGNLFIYAATAIRYIRPPGKFVDSKERLATILAANSASSKSLAPIDTLYSVILTTAIEDETLEPKEQERIRVALWTVVCACEPVLVRTVAAISGLGNRDRAMAALEPLRSVLHISEHSDLATTLHASFPDYMLNRERSGKFACDVQGHNHLLSRYCFEIMKAQLRFNICNLKSSFVPDDEVPDLQERTKTNISEELYYACRFWMNHLGLIVVTSSQNATECSSLFSSLNNFLSHHLLFWMEVLNLMKCMHIGIASISKLNAWLSQMDNPDPELCEYASNAQIFIIGYASRPISNYTSHIYLSALPFAPFLSHYLSRFQGLPKISGIALDRVHQAELGTWESDSPVISIAFLPKSDRIVLGKENGELVVQNINDGKHIFPSFEAHEGPITSIGISYDGTQIVTGSNDMTLSVWNPHDGSLLSGPFKGHAGAIISVSFSPDTSYIASGSHDCIVGFWVSQDSATPMWRMTGHKAAVNSVAFSPCGRQIVSGSSDHSVRLWELVSRSNIFTLPIHEGPIVLARFISNTIQIISLSPLADSENDSGCSIHTWSALNGLNEGFHYQGVTLFALSSEGNRIACVVNNSIDVWDIHDGKLIAGPLQHTKRIVSIGFSPDSTRLTSTCDDQTIRIWHVHSRLLRPQTIQLEEIIPINHKQPFPGTISIAPNQTCVAAALNVTSAIYIINMDLGTTTQSVICIHSPVISLQFSPDTTRMFSLNACGMMHGWNTHTAELADGPHNFPVHGPFISVACSVCGTRVATDFGDSVEIWDVRSNRRLAICKLEDSYPGWTRELTFSQAGNRLLVSDAYIFGIWDTDSGVPVADPVLIPNEKTLDLSPDGMYVACFQLPNWPIDKHMGNIRLVHTITTEATVTLPGAGQLPLRHDILTPYTMEGVSAKFSIDGLHVACALGAECYIWDLRDQTMKATVNNLSIMPQSVAYAPDGWWLVSGMRTNYMAGSVNFQARRFHIDRPFFTLRSDGWLINALSQPLFWVPAEIRDEFPTSDGINIVSDVSLQIKYGDMLVGDDWGKCYIRN
ncbi:unnamed protein product [Rhizoctonia solani]|uniref:Nephrocystin 3-like N-terminal domain-containing protein n=1 Tax=Rhizoctonia solani TaxID=456999 RepID=A0A8H3CUK1_9AGAM|nr:unnamed protein product [Rhizoctonia solani]